MLLIPLSDCCRRRILQLFGWVDSDRCFEARIRRCIQAAEADQKMAETKWRIWAKLIERAPDEPEMESRSDEPDDDLPLAANRTFRLRSGNVPTRNNR